MAAAEANTKPTLVQPTPSPPPAPAPLGPQKRGSRRTPILIALVIILLGAGAAAAITLGSGTDDGGDPTTVAAETEATDSSPEETTEADAAEDEADGYPEVSRAEMEEEIESLLLAFHEDVVAYDFRSAWSLLSARKRRQKLDEEGYEGWKKKGQATLSPYLSPAGLDVRIDDLEGEGIARVMLTGMDWSDPDSSCIEWSGLTWVKYEGGEWTYDPGYSTTPARRRSWEPRSAALLGENC